MLFGFNTEDELKARSALVIYAIYKSRDSKNGPSGVDMWAQIERFARSAAKRADTCDDFVAAFKRKMACRTINPRYLKSAGSSSNARILPTGEIVQFNKEQRDFGLNIFEDETASLIPKCIYEKTQIIILLVRDRLERESIEWENDDE